MKKLLLIIFFLSAFPQFAKAETIYLIINTRYHLSNSTNVIPMETKEKCELTGAKLKSSKRFNPVGFEQPHSVGFECITGK